MIGRGLVVLFAGLITACSFSPLIFGQEHLQQVPVVTAQTVTDSPIAPQWATAIINGTGFTVLCWYFIRVAPSEREKSAEKTQKLIEWMASQNASIVDKFSQIIGDMNEADIKERKNQRLYDESRSERERNEANARYERERVECETRFSKLATMGEERVDRVLKLIGEKNASLDKALLHISNMVSAVKELSNSAIEKLNPSPTPTDPDAVI